MTHVFASFLFVLVLVVQMVGETGRDEILYTINYSMAVKCFSILSARE